MIDDRAKEQSKDLYTVASEFSRLSSMLKSSDLSTPLVQLYEKLSQMVTKQGDFELWNSRALNTQLSSWSKYLIQQTTSFKEAAHLQSEAIKKHQTALA